MKFRYCTECASPLTQRDATKQLDAKIARGLCSLEF